MSITSIYKDFLVIDPNSPPPKAPQKIGDLWARMKAIDPNNSKEQLVSLLEKLGVTKTDQQAHEFLIPMIKAAFADDVTIAPSPYEEETGVYYLSKDGKPVAVFKAGEKRARMELLARHIAHKIGLEKHAIPGLFCSISRPTFPKGETIVELWNGNQKVYNYVPENQRAKHAVKVEDYTQSVRMDNFGVKLPYTLTGILEPFLSSNEVVTAADYASMTAFALCIGLRDGKLNGISGSMFFDTEDCMPPRFLPTTSPNKNVAATHLPYLEDGRANEPIPLQALQEIARKIDEIVLYIHPFLTDLTNQKIEYPDRDSEDLYVPDKELFNYEKHKYANCGWDQGGCYVELVKSRKLIQEKAIVLDNDKPESYQLLSDSQRSACMVRINRLNDFLHRPFEEQTPTCIDMVRAVDPLFDAHLKALERRHYDREPIPRVIGRLTPRQSDSQLSEDERLSVLSASSSSPSPKRALFELSESSMRSLIEDAKR